MDSEELKKLIETYGMNPIFEAMVSGKEELKKIAENGDDPKILLKGLVDYDGSLILPLVSERLRDDEEFILNALSLCDFALSVSTKLQLDRNFVLRAVQVNGFALADAPLFKDDEEIVFEAVYMHGDSIQFASERLRGDYEIALEAVSCSGAAIEHVSETLLDNESIILSAIADDPGAFDFASERLKNDVDFIMRASEVREEIIEYAADWIQAIVGDGDPVEMLKNYIEKKSLRESLAKQTSEKEANTKRRKGGI